MRAFVMSMGLLAAAATLGTAPVARAADAYAIDPAHTSVVFKIDHLGFTSIYGRFNEVAGEFTIDAEKPESSSFDITINTDSVDTGNAKREEHLKSPDFFNAKQFPTITFKSTSVAKTEKGLKVEGDLTLHGETKPVSFVLTGGKTGEFPKDVQRTGYSTEFSIKRSDFGMDKMAPAAGDEVVLLIGFEGTKP